MSAIESCPFAASMTQTVTLKVIDRQGVAHAVACVPGEPMVNALAEAGLVEATCGGCCSCATCQIYVDPQALDRLPTAGDEENDLVNGLLNAQANSRLACQVVVSREMDGLQMTVAPEQ